MDNTVILEIEGNKIKCSRADLIIHSDYFRAMLEGNFVESCKNIIPLKGVDVAAMNTILKVLWDPEYVIEEDVVLSVLQTSCMLQFLQIKNKCLDTIKKILNVKNCLKFWLYTEQLGLKEVYLKAKLMALMEFVSVKDCDCFLETSLDEILRYLGSIYLQCYNEIEIFNAMMKWFENYEDKNENVIFKLLHCLDFAKITENEIDEIISNEHINRYPQIIDVLKCLYSIKTGCDISTFKESCIENAKSLLITSKKRNFEGFPCILAENSKVDYGKKSLKDITYYDKFKRKRRYNVLEADTCTDMSVISLDADTCSFKKVFDLDSQKFANLDGFKVIGYKHFIYLLGGEFFLGNGDWNRNVYVYNVIEEKWTKKTSLPYPRRHFECCICDNNLFVVGGTGPFRVIQENIFWYSLEDEIWSKQYKLPCSSRQIRCCRFNNKLFVLNINSKCGYFFDCDTETWSRVEICDDAKYILPSYSDKLCLFSYGNTLYIKETKLFELIVRDEHLVIVNETDLQKKPNDFCHVESVLCYDKLYSWNEHQMNERMGEYAITLDICDVGNNNKSVCSREFTSNDELFKFKSPFVAFTLFHQDLINENNVVNSFVCN